MTVGLSEILHSMGSTLRYCRICAGAWPMAGSTTFTPSSLRATVCLFTSSTRPGRIKIVLSQQAYGFQRCDEAQWQLDDQERDLAPGWRRPATWLDQNSGCTGSGLLSGICR